ncbi:MAG TPA: hypothetical protein VEX70_01645 [Pyrinomonadaceae bacterium]|nr:hypothetical protein [Pyrinomonadaceae bacterium]
MKRRIEITVEMERVTLTNRHDVSLTTWCELCGARSTHATPDEAARQAGVTPRAVYRCLEAGSLHFTEASGESILVCLKSLAALLGDRPRRAADGAEDALTSPDNEDG